jgi:GT2 family glycosyltransferase
VTWNSLGLGEAAVDSLRRQTTPAAQIILVDNASQDGTLDWAGAQPDIEVVSNTVNRGFAAANNQGIVESTGDLVLLLNADVELASGYIEACLRHFAQPDVSSVTGKLLRPGPERTIDSTGHNVYGLGWAENRGEELPDRGFDSAEEVFGVCAAAALYRRAALDHVAVDGQYLDEAYFAYIEDVDLDWRLRWGGWRAWYEPAAEATHHRSASGGRATAAIARHIVKNRLLTVAKNYDPQSLLINLPGLIAFTLAKTADFGRQHPSAVLGLMDAARLLPRAMRWRRRRRLAVSEFGVRLWLLPFPWRERLLRRLRRPA